MIRQGCCVDYASTKGGRCNGQRKHACMMLPDDKTCADCAHVVRCASMFGAKPSNDHCQFYPRRFSPSSEA